MIEAILHILWGIASSLISGGVSRLDHSPPTPPPVHIPERKYTSEVRSSQKAPPLQHPMFTRDTGGEEIFVVFVRPSPRREKDFPIGILSRERKGTSVYLRPFALGLAGAFFVG